MKTLRSAFIFTVAALLISSCGGGKKETAPTDSTTAPTEDSLKLAAGSYRNEDLTYSITYPKEVLTLQEGTEKGNQQIFLPETGKAKLRIYKDERTDKKTGKEITFDAAYEQDTADTKKRQVIQRSLNPTNYIVSGVDGNEIFYQKTLMKNNGLVTAVLTYTKEEKSTFDPMIASLFGSFK